jgi:hypothetical protein
MTAAVLETQVKESLERSERAFCAGQAGFFEEFAADAVIFTTDSSDPIRGRDAYRQRYEADLCAQSREKTILDRKVQIVADKAVVTQKARIAQANASAIVSQTIVYGITNEGLKVLHAQTSLLSPEAANNQTPTVEVINERIATMAAVVGVAQ